MLTESEREWLNNRDNHAEHFCLWCDAWEDCQGELNALVCPSWTQKVQLREAAEFESLVAAKLATIYSEVESEICHVCPAWFLCFGEQDCRTTILKYARLKVEEEKNGR